MRTVTGLHPGRIKRSHSESIADCVLVPGDLPLAFSYNGADRAQFLETFGMLESHFLEYAHFYLDDTQKIAKAQPHIAEPLWDAWEAFVRRSAVEPTSLEFRRFLYNQARSRASPGQIERQWEQAAQREKQTALTFWLYLKELQRHLPRLVDPDERYNKFIDGLLPDIQSVALAMGYSEDDFSDTEVGHIEQVELSLPRRQGAIHRGREGNPRKRRRRN